MADFTDQVVFVTGAATGIGLGIATAFHAAGARVVMGDFRPEALQAARATLGDTANILTQEVDVRDQDSVARFFAQGEAAFGPANVVVANAGIYPNTPVLDMAQEEWDRVMETNVRGVFLTCQAGARGMVANRIPGKILTVASGAAYSGRKGAAHYCASKAGVVMFTKVLALELAEHHINVNCLSPGLIEVKSEVSPLSEEYTSILTKSIPWGRIGQPDDIAQAALFLASPAADFITGTVLSVDGGSSAGRAFLPPSTPRPATTS
jgi:NAD(P)-dependent dehydrogenase (short-subunit alcohol dehydrogenase family)